MKFEGPPQFDSEHLASRVDKPEKGVEPTQEKIIEKTSRLPENNQVRVETPFEEVELRPEQELAYEEIEKTKEKLQNPVLNTGTEKGRSGEPIIEKENVLQQGAVNRQYIKRAGEQLRKLLHDNISIENLSAFAEQLGVKHIIETPLLRTAGGSGFTQELSDKSLVILYHGILPGTDKYYLSHEIAHALLGHVHTERKGIKQGLKQEWDADTFASSVTRLPQPLALLYCHILDGFIGKLYKLIGPLIKKREIKKINDTLGVFADEIKDAFE